MRCAIFTMIMFFAFGVCAQLIDEHSICDRFYKQGIDYKSIVVETNREISIDLSESSITNLTILHGLPVSTLSLRGAFISDISVLGELPIKILDISSTGVSNLEPIAKTPVTMLNCSDTSITDIEPLSHTYISVLVAANTRISSLSPLVHTPLKTLDIAGTQIDDVTPLGAVALDAIRFSPFQIRKGMNVLRAMKSLRTISVGCETMSVTEFWKRYDNGDFKTSDYGIPHTSTSFDMLGVLTKGGVFSAGEESAGPSPNFIPVTK